MHCSFLSPHFPLPVILVKFILVSSVPKIWFQNLEGFFIFSESLIWPSLWCHLTEDVDTDNLLSPQFSWLVSMLWRCLSSPRKWFCHHPLHLSSVVPGPLISSPVFINVPLFKYLGTAKIMSFLWLLYYYLFPCVLMASFTRVYLHRHHIYLHFLSAQFVLE